MVAIVKDKTIQLSDPGIFSLHRNAFGGEPKLLDDTGCPMRLQFNEKDRVQRTAQIDSVYHV